MIVSAVGGETELASHRVWIGPVGPVEQTFFIEMRWFQCKNARKMKNKYGTEDNRALRGPVDDLAVLLADRISLARD